MTANTPSTNAAAIIRNFMLPPKASAGRRSPAIVKACRVSVHTPFGTDADTGSGHCGCFRRNHGCPGCYNLSKSCASGRHEARAHWRADGRPRRKSRLDGTMKNPAQGWSLYTRSVSSLRSLHPTSCALDSPADASTIDLTPSAARRPHQPHARRSSEGNRSSSAMPSPASSSRSPHCSD